MNAFNSINHLFAFYDFYPRIFYFNVLTDTVVTHIVPHYKIYYIIRDKGKALGFPILKLFPLLKTKDTDFQTGNPMSLKFIVIINSSPDVLSL